MHTSPISFQGGQKPNNNQLESLICAPQVLFLQVLFQAGKNLNSLTGRMISLFYRILAFLKSNLEIWSIPCGNLKHLYEICPMLVHFSLSIMG